MADVCTREIGILAPAAADWTMMETAFPLSLVFVFQGLSATIFGKWQIKVGPRASMAAASVAFGGGLMLGAAGIHYHSLPLLYAGYGVMGGTGIGLGYTPPIQALMQWFPDKKGIASGLTIAGFGSGALFFVPTVQYLMKQFQKMPDFLGSAEKVVTKAMDGKIFADVNGQLIEAVNVGAAELSKLPYSGLSEGLYAVGTGSTGASEALAIMGAGYFSVILASAMALRTPHPSYVVPGMEITTTSSAVAKVPDVTVDEVMKTPQFHLLGTAFFCVATGGMGLMSVAKPMMSDVFSTLLPAVVTSAFASKYLLMLSAGNLSTLECRNG
jgi:MFS family permease